MYMWCLFYTKNTYDLSSSALCLSWHYYYLSAASLGQGEIIGLLVVQYENFGTLPLGLSTKRCEGSKLSLLLFIKRYIITSRERLTLDGIFKLNWKS